MHQTGHRLREFLAPRYDVIRMDLRGHGFSDHITGPVDAHDLARDAKDVLDAADVRKCCVVGFSLGGLVAQALALDFPERVDKIAVIGTPCGRTAGERARAADRIAFLEQHGVGALAESNRNAVVHRRVPEGASGRRCRARGAGEQQRRGIVSFFVPRVLHRGLRGRSARDCGAGPHHHRRARCGGHTENGPTDGRKVPQCASSYLARSAAQSVDRSTGSDLHIACQIPLVRRYVDGGGEVSLQLPTGE